MLKWFKPEYRIVRDFWAGYAVEVRYWYWPFWDALSCATHATPLEASDWLKARLEREQWSLYLGRM
jgi:hypothetical protein